MTFKLDLAPKASEAMSRLQNDPAQIRILKDVIKALELMKTNLRHPSLNTHQYYGYEGPQGEKVFESYAQQKTSGAYRIFWHYGPTKGTITILLIIPHP